MEQQSFEMPYYGHRWSANSLEVAFEGAFTRVEELPSRELIIRSGNRRALGIFQ